MHKAPQLAVILGITRTSQFTDTPTRGMRLGWWARTLRDTRPTNPHPGEAA